MEEIKYVKVIGPYGSEVYPLYLGDNRFNAEGQDVSKIFWDSLPITCDFNTSEGDDYFADVRIDFGGIAAKSSDNLVREGFLTGVGTKLTISTEENIVGQYPNLILTFDKGLSGKYIRELLNLDNGDTLTFEQYFPPSQEYKDKVIKGEATDSLLKKIKNYIDNHIPSINLDITSYLKDYATKLWCNNIFSTKKELEDKFVILDISEIYRRRGEGTILESSLPKNYLQNLITIAENAIKNNSVIIASYVNTSLPNKFSFPMSVSFDSEAELSFNIEAYDSGVYNVTISEHSDGLHCDIVWKRTLYSQEKENSIYDVEVCSESKFNTLTKYNGTLYFVTED